MLTHPTPPATSATASVVTTSSSQRDSPPPNLVDSNSTPIQSPDSTAASIPKPKKQTKRKAPGKLQPAKVKPEDIQNSDKLVEIADTSTPSGNGDRKRSRKQKIDNLRNVFELSPAVPVSEDKVVGGKGKKGVKKLVKKGGSRKASASQSEVSSIVTLDETEVSSTSGSILRRGLVRSSRVLSTSASHAITGTVSNDHPDEKLDFAALIDPLLSFTTFHDLSRDLAVIGPSQVLVAVDTIREPGESEDIVENVETNTGLPFNQYLRVPHFLPLKSVYCAGEPFSRVLKFSELEEFTCSRRTDNPFKNHNVTSFRFYGRRFEKQVPVWDPPKDSKAISLVQQSTYRISDLVIKHQLLGRFVRKVINLKFIILKRIKIDGGVVLGVIKRRVVQLRRSPNLRNVEIYVDESNVQEIVSDVRAMNQQNIQPVIQTSSGIVPVLARSNYLQQVQQQQNIQQETYMYAPPNEQEYQYQCIQYQISEPVLGNTNSFATESNYANYSSNTEESGSLVVHGEYLGNETRETVLIFDPHNPNTVVVQEAQPEHYSQQVIHQQHLPPQQQQLIQQHQQPNIYSAPVEQLNFPLPLQSQIFQDNQRLAVPQAYSSVVPQQQYQSQEQAYHSVPQQQHHQSQQQPLVVVQSQQQVITVQNEQQLIAVQNHLQQQRILSSQQAEQLQQQQQQSLVLQQRQEQQVNSNSSNAVLIGHIVVDPATLGDKAQNCERVYRDGKLIGVKVGLYKEPGPPQQIQTPGQQPPSPAQNQQTQVQLTTPAQQQIQASYSSSSLQLTSGHPHQQNIVQLVPQPHHHQAGQGVQYSGQIPNQVKQSSPAITQPLNQQLISIRELPQHQQTSLPLVNQHQQLVPSLQSPAYRGVTNSTNSTQSFQPSQETPFQPLKQVYVSSSSQHSVSTPVSTTVIVNQKGVLSKTKKQPKTPSKKAKQQQAEQAVVSLSQIVPLVSQQQLQQDPQRFRPSVPAIVGAQSRAPGPGTFSVVAGKNTHSLVRPPVVSSCTSGVLVSGAAKSQILSAQSHLTTATALSATKSSSKGKGNAATSFAVISSSSSAISANSSKPVIPVTQSLTPVPVPTPVAPTSVIVKPGFAAVCSHCGACSRSLNRCERCKTELSADAKLVKDTWSLNKTSAAIVELKQVMGKSIGTPAITSTQTVANLAGVQVKNSNNNNNNNNKTLVTAQPKATSGKTQRKIIVVNKPALISNSPVVKAKPAPAILSQVQVKIQADGGSSVTIVSSAAGAPTETKRIPKKRAPPRKRQQECITLSSDEEEPEPNHKVAKSEPVPVCQPVQQVNTASVGVEVKEENDTSVEQEGKTEQSPLDTATEKDTDMKKGISINLSSGVKSSPSKEADETPDQVLEKITTQMQVPGGKIQYVMIESRSIRIGSYKVTTGEVGFKLPLTITDLGLKFTVPYSNIRTKPISVCIPMRVILSIKAHLHKRLCVLFVTTGPKYAAWLRDKVGLDGSPKAETSNYYCPTDGAPGQKLITFLLEPIEGADLGTVRAIFKHLLDEMDYNAANELLMSITPQCYKSSISYKSSNISEDSSSKNSNQMTNPNSSPIPSAASSDVSSSSNNTKEAVKTASGPVVSSSTSLVDSDVAVLFYEGKNNIKVPISPKDICCLGYSQFLNDQIIDFWLAVIQTEILSDKDQKRTFVFDSFFYSKLTEKVKKRTADEGTMTAGERRHARVKKRTKNVDIFEKDFLIIPINENYHWFIAIICFPGLQGYHDYDTLEPIQDFKRARVSLKPTENSKKPIVYSQPKSESTASYSNRDEAPEDPDEEEELSKNMELSEIAVNSQGSTKSQKTETFKSKSTPTRPVAAAAGVKRKAESDGRRVKHPCILIFDSLAGDIRARVFATLREYLKIEYKTKKNEERIFDKITMPGWMPRVPQQPNFSDCGLYMLQYIESFFSNPIPNYIIKEIDLMSWFDAAIANNKRKEIYDFIKMKVEQHFPDNLSRIPQVSFEAGDDDMMPHEHQDGEAPKISEEEDDDDDDDWFETLRRNVKKKPDDHNYAKGDSPSKELPDI